MPENRPSRVTVSGRNPVSDGPVPDPAKLPDGQHADHWVLSKEERAKGFLRPVRHSYRHAACGVVTSMPQAIAETYARQPSYYNSTFCCGCKGYFPVGHAGDFSWADAPSEKVGT